MRFGIGARLGLFASFLVLGTATVLWYQMRTWSSRLLLEHKLADLGGDARLFAEDLLIEVQQLRENTFILAGNKEFRDLLRNPGKEQSQLRQRAEKAFRAFLNDHPEYLEVGYVPIPEHAERALLVRQSRGNADGTVSGKADAAAFPGLENGRDQVQVGAVRRDGAVKVDGVAVPYLQAASAIYMSGETPAG